MSPLKAGKVEASKTGTTIQTKEGISRFMMSLAVVTLFPIQSMVVVTSPMGDQAPPALAAITIKPANHNLVLLSLIIFCSMVIKTMVAVRLSIMADRINAIIEKITSKPFLDFVLIKLLMVAKPLK